VIYASIFGESTAGAAPGRKVDPAKVKILQEIADAAAGVSAK
jgi:hypothetical protein